MNHLLRNGDGHLKNYGILYENDYEDARLAPIYDVITTTVYIKNDIPALKLGDGKLWFKEKTYRNFAKLSCGLSKQEYEETVLVCINAVVETKKEIDLYESEKSEIKEFLRGLKDSWVEKI